MKKSKREKLLEIVSDYKVKITFRKIWVLTTFFTAKDLRITFEPRTKEISLKKAQKALNKIPKKYHSLVISSFAFFANNTVANICKTKSNMRENIKNEKKQTKNEKNNRNIQ